MNTLKLIFALFFSISGISQNLQNRVLVIKNTNSPVSTAVANDYMLRRNVNKVLNINFNDSSTDSNSEFMSFAEYNTFIKTPLMTYLNSHPEIDFIVLTKGIPNKIYGAPNKPYGGDCSVDSQIASLGYENSSTSSIVNFNIPDGANNFTGQAYANKFWNSQTPFSHATFGGYLVTRLDGYTQTDAIALTTRSLQAEANIGIANSGTILLDACGTFGFDTNFTQPNSIFPQNYVAGQTINIVDDYSYSNFNSDIALTNSQLLANGITTQYDSNANFVGNVSNLNGYVSWGSNDSNYNASSYNSLTFRVGAIAETAVSTGARTFLPTNVGQSLIANLISQGATGVKGYAVEPLLLGVGSPSILFNRYTRGWTMAESFYASAKLVGWMDVMIGDPICRAYSSNLSVDSFYSDKRIVAYPNPTTEFIQIKNLENLSVLISDMLGKTVLEVSNYESNTKIDISKLEKGIYFIRFKENLYSSLKFVKQ
jgi:uncharacterized protein (TIGR03790 family)